MNRYPLKRTGQISIDYMAGAMVFFGAIIILITSVMSAVPEVQENRNLDDLQMVSLSASEVLMNNPGYWAEDATTNGTDWHQVDPVFIETLGIQHSNRTGVKTDKITAMQQMDYAEIQSVLSMERDFNARFTVMLYIDTSNTFIQGEAPDHIVEPAYPPDTEDRIHYGTENIDGTTYHFLTAASDGWYNEIWISTDWDFSDADHYDLSDTQILTIDQNTYVTNIGDTQISDGNLIILRRQLGTIGTAPPEHTDNVIRVDRFDTTAEENHVIHGVFHVW